MRLLLPLLPLLLTFLGQDSFVYLNGEKSDGAKAKTPYGDGVKEQDMVLVIGGLRAGDGTYNSDVSVSDVRVYNWQLTDAEVAALIKAGRRSAI